MFKKTKNKRVLLLQGLLVLVIYILSMIGSITILEWCFKHIRII